MAQLVNRTNMCSTLYVHVKIYVEAKKAKQQQEQERGCGSDDAMIISVVFYFIKNNCSKGPGLVAAAMYHKKKTLNLKSGSIFSC